MLTNPEPELAQVHAAGAPAHRFRPSEYTAFLIQALRSAPARVRGARVLEIGSGSGVVLAALGALGPASLCGIDVEHEAIQEGTRLLRALGYDDRAEFHRGDMWLPVAGRRFDMIVANLPHFPTERGDFAGRFPTWSDGGRDGRRLLDPFLRGVVAHLAPGGHAVITHNAFVGLEQSRDMVVRSGLSFRVAGTMLLHIPGEKLDRMTRSVLRAEEGRSIHHFGAYAFAEMHIVEIGKPDTLG
ncbi:MAG TPA: methyltransferase domain-containing protein [Aliidongia sp.]|nr:methyltransferase domain-containing protein [Aliidongia sp.]